MKHIKEYSGFSDDIETFNDIKDIFVNFRDFNLFVNDVYEGNAISIGKKSVVTDHNDFSSNDIFKSLSIRLKPTHRHEFQISDEELFSELNYSIGHVESLFNLKLMHVYLRSFEGIWFDSIDSMKNYIHKLSNTQIKYTTYIDLTFKHLENISESKKWEIEHYLDDILDIFREYADEYDLKYVDDFYNLQQWHSGELDNCYTLRYPSKSSWCTSVDILFDDYFGSAGIDGMLGEDFQMDVREFIRRLEKLGLECEIDWSGGSSYTIDIYSK
jgi:hypothetical protein